MHRSHRRRPLVALLALAVVLVCAATVLRPTSTTQARWHDEETIAVAVATDTVALHVTPGESRATFALAGTSAVEWAPREVSVAAGAIPLTAADLAGSTVGYALPDAGACLPGQVPDFAADLTAVPPTATTFPVTGGSPVPLEPGGVAALCLVVEPGSALRAAHPGTSLRVTTAVASRARGPASWTSSAAWTGEVLVPALPTVTATCATVTERGPWWKRSHVQLAWGLSETDGATTQSIALWQVQRRAGDGWEPVGADLAADTAATTVTGWDFPQQDWEIVYDLRIVAVLEGGTTITSDELRVGALVGTAWCAR
ncbi:hypothetical protein [Georgenia subflava]|uniref:hypothetical protein n=1 Tax=Georgenia subflava TaxID=1622177 RepID=UPI00186B4F79|nr:hypothetical protein [Georgenia subflava]